MSCQCQNCDWEGDDGDCREIQNLSERVEPGEIMPSGECPECGALCYPWAALDLRVVDQLTRRVGDNLFVITPTDDGLQVQVQNKQLVADHLNLRLTSEGLIIDGVEHGEISGSSSRMWSDVECDLTGDSE